MAAICERAGGILAVYKIQRSRGRHNLIGAWGWYGALKRSNCAWRAGPTVLKQPSAVAGSWLGRRARAHTGEGAAHADSRRRAQASPRARRTHRRRIVQASGAVNASHSAEKNQFALKNRCPRGGGAAAGGGGGPTHAEALTKVIVTVRLTTIEIAVNSPLVKSRINARIRRNPNLCRDVR